MITYIWHFITGYLILELHGSSPERFFNMCMHHKIKIWNMDTDSNIYTFCMSVKDYKQSKAIIKKSNIELKILYKKGIPFIGYRYRKRKAFAAGFLFSLLSIYFLSLHIWYIEIQGNLLYTDETLIQFINQENVQIAMKGSLIDCDELEANIRQTFSDIIWVSVHVDGSKLIVNIKENETTIPSISILQTYEKILEVNATVDTSEETSHIGYDIIAETDGVITSIVTRKGTPLVHAGDTVTKGDILVTGCMELTDDYDEIISYQYVTSDADIMIQTTYSYSDEASLAYNKKTYLDTIKHYFYLKKDAYTIYPVEKEYLLSEGVYQEISTKEIQLSPDQQNILTLFLGIKTVKFYELTESLYSENEIQEILTSRFLIYCGDLEEKKAQSQILWDDGFLI